MAKKKKSKMTPYFAYGSNLNHDGMEFRCPGAKLVGPARLADWRLTFRGVADIEPAEGRVVQGALWMATPADVRALDRYEGAPRFYEQVWVEVEMPDGRKRRAMTYVMTDGHRGRVGLPSQGYYNSIHDGFAHCGIESREELERALEETIEEHRGLGVDRYRADGPKRLMAVRKPLVAETSEAWDDYDRAKRHNPQLGMSPATVAEMNLERRLERQRELQMGLAIANGEV